MFPVGYWTPRYWPGTYWPPTGLVVQLPAHVPLEAILSPASLIAAISLTDSLMAIITPGGVISARIDQEEATWLAEEQPPFATLVRGDLSAVLGADALAVQMRVVYVSSKIVAEILNSKLDEEAIVSVVLREDQSVTLDA